MRSLGRAALTAALIAFPALAQGPVQRFTLDNGLPVTLREEQGRPLFRVRLRLALHPGDLPPGKEGLVALALRMMDLGEAGHLGPTAFDRALDEGGIRLTRTLSADAITWNLVSRGRDQDRALGLLADRVLRPILDPSALESQRLACGQDQKEVLASPEASLCAALGLDGPSAATEKSLSLLTFKDLQDFLRRVFRPDRAILALEGDLGPEQARALVLLSFGTWTGGTLPPATTPPQATAPVPSLAPVARIAASGAPLRVEAAAPPPEGLHPALWDLAVLLLHDDPALAPATMTAPAEPGTPLRFTLAAPPAGLTADRALAALRDRLGHLRRRGYTEADLARAKAAWTAGRQVQALHPQALLADDVLAVAGRLAQPADVAAATLEGLNGAMLLWLDPARLRWAVIGDPKDLPKQ